jgi:ABC-type multidrug transport system fused ATPase/permease subunit
MRLAVHVVKPHSHENVRSRKILFYNMCNRLAKFNTGKYDAIISQNLSIYDFCSGGYDTMAGGQSRVAQLSVRQKQKIGIARPLLRNP